MYRYKAPHDGCTRFSIKGLKYIDKIGKLISIEAYIVATYPGDKYLGKTPVNLIRVIVRGENGTCTYGGFNWGYGGEGPHGLRDMFIKCGMSKELADHYAFSMALGPWDYNRSDIKLYNATTLWKFQNSDIGWNLVKNEKQVPKFKKGQKLLCSYTWREEPYKCKFVKMCYGSDNVAAIKTNTPKLFYVPLRTLTVI